jgi:integrase
MPRANDNRARAKAGISRTVPASAELMRLYADYLTREYGDLDSDYVFVNLWSRPYGRPWTYAAVYDLVLRLRERTGIDFEPHHYRHILSALCSCRDSRHRRASGPAACAVRLPPPRCRLLRNHVKRVSLPAAQANCDTGTTEHGECGQKAQLRQRRAAGRGAEYLGHSDPAFTLRVYCHLMPGSPDRMRQAIDRAFSESPDCPGIAPEGETGL